MIDATYLLRDLLDGVRGLDDLSEGEIAAVLTERFPRAPVGDLIREGVPPVEMVVDGWLVRGSLHWFQGPPEEGKSWAILALVAQVLEAGGVVLYADEELGRERVAERLGVLDVAPEIVDARFHYHEFPTLTEEDAELWAALVERTRPTLVAYETGTDFLAVVGASENSGNEVTRWIKTFPERATRFGAAVVVSDHITKDGDSGGWAVGSRAKRAKAKVVLELRAQSAFDPQTVAKVNVTTHKNTNAAPGLGPRGTRRTFEMGGDGKGGFIFREVSKIEDQKHKEQEVRKAKEFRDAVVDALSSLNGRKGLSQRALFKAVRDAGFVGTDEWMRPRLAGYIESPAIPVGMSKEGQTQFYYAISDTRHEDKEA